MKEKKKKTDHLLALIREGRPMTSGEQLRLTVALSVPAIVTQLSAIVMQYIDAAMVGSLGANASASIGLVSTTTWLFWGLCAAASTGFSVQVAHRIGAGDWDCARSILRRSVPSTFAFSALLAAIGVSVSGALPQWLGGDSAIRSDASLYFLIFSLFLPILQMNFLAAGMLRCSGNMRIPSIAGVLMCILDVVFNFFLIFPSRELSVGGLTLSIPGAGLGVQGAALGTGLAESSCRHNLMVSLHPFVRLKDKSMAQKPVSSHATDSPELHPYQPADGPGARRHLRSTNHDHRHRGPSRHSGHSGQLICHHRRKPLLHARIRDSRRRNHVGRTKPRCRTASAHSPLCLHHRIHGHGGHGNNGRRDVHLCPADYRYDDSRGRNPQIGRNGTPHRSFCRADVCGSHHIIRRIRRGSQYPRPVIDELFQHLGRANLVGGVARSHHGPERCMGGHVCGIVLPWNHIPDPAERKTVDENLTGSLARQKSHGFCNLGCNIRNPSTLQSMILA